jgi:hypothetical protein
VSVKIVDVDVDVDDDHVSVGRPDMFDGKCSYVVFWRTVGGFDVT